MDVTNVIYLTIVALFLIFKVVVKQNNTDEQQSAEVFPPIEPLIPEEEEMPEQQPRPAPAKPAKRPVQQKPVTPAPVEAAKEEPAKKERPSYGIKSKSDAKRAIIYSEIFKRKY